MKFDELEVGDLLCGNITSIAAVVISKNKDCMAILYKYPKRDWKLTYFYNPNGTLGQWRVIARASV